MSNAKTQEDCPLMENPSHPVPGADPEVAPPSYSSLFGPQTYNSVPSAPEPAPSNGLRPQDSTVPVHGRPMTQSSYISPYAPTTYVPMDNVPSVNQATVVSPRRYVVSQSDDSTSRAKRWRCVKVFVSTLAVVALVLFVIRLYKNNMEREKAVARQIKASDYIQLQRNVWSLRAKYHNYYSRKKRMVYQEESNDLKNFDLLDLNFQPLIKDPSRHRRQSPNQDELWS